PNQLPGGPRSLVAIIITSIFTAGSVLAWRNWRRGRAHPAGAFRVAGCAFLPSPPPWGVLGAPAAGFFDAGSILHGHVGWGGRGGRRGERRARDLVRGAGAARPPPLAVADGRLESAAGWALARPAGRPRPAPRRVARRGHHAPVPGADPAPELDGPGTAYAA